MLLLQERWQVKDSKYSRASPAAPAAHKPSTALMLCLLVLVAWLFFQI